MSDPQLFTGYFLVVFFDLLGQREGLRAIKEIPTRDAEMPGFLGLLRDTIGRVLTVRRLFAELFAQSARPTPDVSLVSAEDREEFAACLRSEVLYFSLSDATVVTVPLAGDDEQCTASNSVYDALIVTSGVTLELLAAGIPCRAGIDVGVATRIHGSEVYGPALERAIALEARAGYPRLVVGPELRNYLNDVGNQRATTRPGIMARQSARRCKRMLARDADGEVILDYARVATGWLKRKLLPSLRSALTFAESEYRRFLQCQNMELANRYAQLQEYLRFRLVKAEGGSIKRP